MQVNWVLLGTFEVAMWNLTETRKLRNCFNDLFGVWCLKDTFTVSYMRSMGFFSIPRAYMYSGKKTYCRIQKNILPRAYVQRLCGYFCRCTYARCLRNSVPQTHLFFLFYSLTPPPFPNDASVSPCAFVQKGSDTLRNFFSNPNALIKFHKLYCNFELITDFLSL